MATCFDSGDGTSRSMSCWVSGPPNAVKTSVLDMMFSPWFNVNLSLWRLIFARSFSGVGFFFRCILGIHRVLGRGVNGVEHERFVAGVAEVVLGSGRHGALVSGFNRVGFPVEVTFAGAGKKGQDLVGVLMDFVANFAADRHR